MIKLANVSVSYAGSAEEALTDVTITVREGSFCAVLGPNGAGKTTLVKLLTGAIAPTSGQVLVAGRDPTSRDRRGVAQTVAVVPQAVDVALGFSTREVVMMGRAPHQGLWMRASPEDEAAVDDAIAACDLAGLGARPVASLSGGEQKRVAIARALAQKTPILILDEANAHLDVRHTIAIHEVLSREIARRRLTVVAVLHDLNAAAQYANDIILMKAGRVVAQGAVEAVMTYRRLKEVFEAELYVGVNELDGARYFLPVRPDVPRTGGGERPGSRPPGSSDL